MQYNTPNYRLVEAYINNKVSTTENPNEQKFDNSIIQSAEFDRNGLRGNRNLLHSQINEIMAQTDYNMRIPERYESPKNPLKIAEEPQDMLNDKRKTEIEEGDRNLAGRFIPTNGQANGGYSNMNGQYPGSVNGQYPGSINGQYPGSVNGQYPGSINGQYPGSVNGPYYGGPSSGNMNGPYGGQFNGPVDGMINPYIQNGQQGYIHGKPSSFLDRILNNWTIGKTIILVVILLALFYLILRLILQRRTTNKPVQVEGNMNPPVLETNQTPPEEVVD